MTRVVALVAFFLCLVFRAPARADDVQQQLAILLQGPGPDAERLVANVSDGGSDCRRHNNNNRLDTRGIQKWIDDTVKANRKP